MTPQVFDGLRKQYGIGRYHLPRERDQIVYSRNDLEQIKSIVPRARQVRVESGKPDKLGTARGDQTPAILQTMLTADSKCRQLCNDPTKSGPSALF